MPRQIDGKLGKPNVAWDRYRIVEASLITLFVGVYGEICIVYAM
jgi:hypothetical protein